MRDQTLTRPTMTRPTTGLPDPAMARRLRPPSWRDPRLLVGIALVLASVVAGALVVSAVDNTVPVYAAARPLAAGDALDVGDLAVVSVRLGDHQSRYLSAASAPAPGQVMVRAVAAGELVPTGALGTRDQVDLRPVSVPLAAEGSDRIGEGVLVDVWVAARDPDRGAGAYAAPQQLAAGIQVAGRSTRSGALGSSTSTAVQLLVGSELLPQLIGAVDNGARITLVPVPATLPRDRS